MFVWIIILKIINTIKIFDKIITFIYNKIFHNYIQKKITKRYMDAELTIKLDKQILEKAKDYASSNNRNLSFMIESFLKSLVERNANTINVEISSYVKSISTGVKIPADFDYKQEYTNYLTNKYR